MYLSIKKNRENGQKVMIFENNIFFLSFCSLGKVRLYLNMNKTNLKTNQKRSERDENIYL